MPRYEYVCEECGERFAKIRRIDERDDAIECPSCGKESKRELSTFSVGGGDGSKSLSSGSPGCTPAGVGGG